MGALTHLLHNNRAWSDEVRARDPGFFRRLAGQQSPDYFWVGCSDSRVPANTIIDLPPGEVFVHRNVANMVQHSDMNCLSAMQFAVDVLAVKHIIVCGHYGCSGVSVAIQGQRVGLADNWLRHVQDVAKDHAALLEATASARRLDLLCRLNVVEQVVNVTRTTIVQEAWDRGQPLRVHGLVYSIADGRLRDLDITVAAAEDVAPRRAAVVERLAAAS